MEWARFVKGLEYLKEALSLRRDVALNRSTCCHGMLSGTLPLLLEIVADALRGMLALLERIQDWNGTLKGDLAFVNNWKYFSNDPSSHHGQLTTTGPYAGDLTASRTGDKLRTRYSHLLPLRGSPPVNLWASDCNRVIETARFFSKGFFGGDWASKAKLHVIAETSDLGADTLTPGETCLRYLIDVDHGHDNGARQLVKFRSTYLPSISSRLQKKNPGIVFSNEEIFSMQELCGFEILVRGKSPWCDVFTHDEWLSFEYARDVIHYYRSGPGNPYGPAIGWLWLNATAELLKNGPNSGKLFFSFVHDGDVVPMLAALDIFNSSERLPTTHLSSSRTWRTSQVVPMGGRVIFERLSCQFHKPLTMDDKRAQYPFRGEEFTEPEEFVRININDGIVALPTCSSGPGSSCPLEEFLGLVRDRGTQIGDFREICGLGPDAASRITFLHQ
ncbi:acid phosphatase pho5 [Pseudocyphellaria aurata]|nr:acid phosphatase pho5 [Pseudocyphellaria aurata]